ncbi:MAG: segregation/condensation protein A [Anaerolineales bacterium]|jgi:segregation and condensation protein A
MTSYEVQLPVYEGPLDLLLDLIERAELEISKVSLAIVADQYLDYLRKVPEHKLEDLASFLVVAARLLQIKSESLLPRPPVREPGEEDPGDALARQLVAYKKYKQIAMLLDQRHRAGLRSYLRLSPVALPEPKLDLGTVQLEDLRQALLDALSVTPSSPELDKVVAPIRVRLKDQIHLIIDTLRKKGRTSFRKLVKKASTRLEIVISFLAILELIKLEQVKAEQQELFGDIEILPGAEWKQDQDVEFELEFE